VALNFRARLLSQPSLEAARRRRWRSRPHTHDNLAIDEIDSVPPRSCLRLGALMCVGIVNYAPSMALLAFLGMHPIAAYPIMIASDGVLIPVASLGFLRSGRLHPRSRSGSRSAESSARSPLSRS